MRELDREWRDPLLEKGGRPTSDMAAGLRHQLGGHEGKEVEDGLQVFRRGMHGRLQHRGGTWDKHPDDSGGVVYVTYPSCAWESADNPRASS